MSLLQELKRRKVFRTTFGYVTGVAATALFMQALVAVVGLSPSFVAGTIILGLVALPLVVALAWAFDLTSEGVEVTAKDPESSRVAVSWKRVTLPLVAVILILLATASFIALKKSEALLQQQPTTSTADQK